MYIENISQIIEAASGASNPKTIRKRIKSFGADPKDVYDIVMAAVSKRRQRMLNRPREDSLLTARRMRKFKVKELKAKKRVRSLPCFAHIDKKAQKDAIQYADIDRHLAEAIVINGTIKAIARKARSAGVSVEVSKGRDGKVASYYLRTDTGYVRISNHDLPDTAERAWKRENGFAGSWSLEIVIDAHMTPIRLRRMIVLGLAGRDPWEYV